MKLNTPLHTNQSHYTSYQASDLSSRKTLVVNFSIFLPLTQIDRIKLIFGVTNQNSIVNKINTKVQDLEPAVIGYSDTPLDVYGISYWDDEEVALEGNSYASPMIALGVAMILKQSPDELYEGIDEDVSPIEKAELLQSRIIQILQKNSKSINKTQGAISYLDLRMLQSYL